ncbi:phenylalanyl-tRNA synthetase beta chain [Pseudohyphozyma bogoriensis]|nr:phenylalanyl-tRNA synthetase beta chain [Pseudohyphozyma bogoriensis]
MEGIVRALKLWLHPEIGAPNYRLVPAPEGKERVAYVRPETAKIRPYFACAILRGVKFDDFSYKSFIDLQDKLHANLARKRTLVAVGTHDLSKIAPGDISYEALPPKDIKFAPLNKKEEYTAEELMVLYKEDKHLSRYLHIIEDSPVYPIIYDTTRQVLSMPPIINSDFTKISLDTKDVFIDVTATDETKLYLVLDVLVTMFSEYCSEPFTVEPVKVVYTSASPGGERTVITPSLAPRPFVARTSYINSCTGLSLSRPEVVKLLRQMGHDASAPVPGAVFAAINERTNVQMSENDIIHVLVPPSRPDILHECDIMEDAAVAYGFDNLKKTFPTTNTVAKPFPPNKLSDTMRRLCSEAGWLEVLPLTLCSHDENFKFLNRVDDGKQAVVLANPKTIEYQVVRTSLLPGMLKTIRENRKHALPLRIFEVNDVVLKDSSVERNAKNVRRLGSVFCGRKAGFEIVHGLLDRLMVGLGVQNLLDAKLRDSAETGYYIKPTDDATYFPNRGAEIYYRPPLVAGAHTTFAPVASADASNATATSTTSTPAPSSDSPSTFDNLKDKLASALPSSASSRDVRIGSLGILHPSVLKSFELDYPCSSLEFDLEIFL